MGCCGGKPRYWRPAPAAPSKHATTSMASAPQVANVTFEYLGGSAMTVKGPITGRAYRFDQPGARVAVDRRDAPSVAGVPRLRRL